ncbi:reticulocyte-binding protein 2 homolog a [Elysia marginata]|uniref:Reticulocyte-binding protein 2 homolog a n=1 Tax=Elysia marginata TaxID=1093978 RepID=A0AAV4F088_9GAST|nr:reticulocyte-binding protein 2 homolog a [Elysia marginata]
MFGLHHNRERMKCLQVLGLQGHPTVDEIKSAYKKQALKYHPDKNSSPNATEKFQQIHAAYKYLTEGEKCFEHLDEEDSILIHIFKSWFPWMFRDEDSRPQSPDDFRYRHFSHSHDRYWDSSPESEGGRFRSRSSASPPPNSGPFRPNYSHFYGEDDFVPPQNQRRGYPYKEEETGNTNFRGRTFHTSRPSESGASQHFRQQANFTESNQEHGQYFRENTKTSKKSRRKAQKRANYEEADERRRANAEAQQKFDAKSQPSEAQQRAQAAPKGANCSDQTSNGPSSHIKVEKGYTGPTSNPDRKPNKKERKQEEKRKQKELQEIREQMEKDAREAKEKLERKRKAQEEKERIEKEERQEKERIEREKREAEEKKRQEERRLQREKEEKERQERLRKEREQQEQERQRHEEELRIQALMDEFDSVNLLDDNGEFKVTDPDVINIIRRDDLNAMGNAHSGKRNDQAELINGFRTKDLIELQQAADKAKGGNRSGIFGISKLINGEAHETPAQAQSASFPSRQAGPQPGQDQSQYYGGARPKTSWRGQNSHSQYNERSQHHPNQQYHQHHHHSDNYNGPLSSGQFPNSVNFATSVNGNAQYSQGRQQHMHRPNMYGMPPMQTYGPAPTPIQPLFGFPRRGRREFGPSQKAFSGGRAY